MGSATVVRRLTHLFEDRLDVEHDRKLLGDRVAVRRRGQGLGVGAVRPAVAVNRARIGVGRVQERGV